MARSLLSLTALVAFLALSSAAQSAIPGRVVSTPSTAASSSASSSAPASPTRSAMAYEGAPGVDFALLTALWADKRRDSMPTASAIPTVARRDSPLAGLVTEAQALVTPTGTALISGPSGVVGADGQFHPIGWHVGAPFIGAPQIDLSSVQWESLWQNQRRARREVRRSRTRAVARARPGQGAREDS
ncbi:hypothetical protein PsYK624_096770 [Phanerochaete sordida]|uniref:Uncharacterized protein n=1 Tax=Phanerochaete sordida TaxID=48140 RepID=A0A9P3GEN9_9APHY|nr:hypothetical protein PsYK624_096770 [Phanerochaete sordida]